MAFPYGKFYQKMTIDGVTKDWDLADICESDVAGRGDLTTIANYKVSGAPISYPSIPTNAYSLKGLKLSFYENNNQIIIPKSGTFPSIYPRIIFRIMSYMVRLMAQKQEVPVYIILKKLQIVGLFLGQKAKFIMQAAFMAAYFQML